MNIPKQLQNPDFRFVLLGKWNNWAKYKMVDGRNKMTDTKEMDPMDYPKIIEEKIWKPLGKAPFERKWQKLDISYNSQKLLKHIKDFGNFGIIGGYGRLRILDVDDVALGNLLEKQMDTFTVKTGSGGKHCYFLSDYKTNHVLINDLGELRANNYQVVCSPSRHPNGNNYLIHMDKPLREISEEELIKIIKPYMKESQPKEQSTLGDKPMKDSSRSALEYRKVLALLREGKNKEEIFKQMGAYSKWVSSPEQYKELTFNKAQEFLKKYNAEELDSDFEIFTDKDIMNYEPKEQKWLIEDQIPQGEIGTLAGKRGERKTFTALYQSVCLASKTKTFDNEVPKKGKVLFISEEDGIDTIATRIKGIKKGLGIEEELGIRYLCLNGLKLDRQDLKFQKFKDLIEDFLPDLIIVDALQRCVTFEVDKDNRAISELFTEIIRPLTRKYGMSWVFITHLRKSPTQGSVVDPLDEIRGGSELVNYSRFVLSCQAPKYQTKTEGGTELIVFRVLKMSNSRMPQDKVVSFTNVDDKININYEGIPEDVLAGEIQSANAIKDWLFGQQLTSFQTKEITQASDTIGFKKSLISMGLKLLVRDGFLKKPKRGYYEVIGKAVDTSQDVLMPLKDDIPNDELEKMAEES